MLLLDEEGASSGLLVGALDCLTHAMDGYPAARLQVGTVRLH